MNELDLLNIRLRSLAIFRDLLEDKAIQRLSQLLACPDKPTLEQVERYSAFAAQLFQDCDNLTEYVLDRVLAAENAYVLRRAQGLPVSGAMEACLHNELSILSDISQISAEKIRAQIRYDGFLPAWENSPLDIRSRFIDRMETLPIHGYGIFSRHHMFKLRDGAVAPIGSPDRIRLSDLKGYASERKTVIDNTLALIGGKPAASVLLYGDAGTGKSSTVKAVANAFADQGLRLIEIARNQLLEIPALVEALNRNPLKFILFIDDLSFTQDNNDYRALKAILEGSVSARAANIVMYATSNRRHLVKESFSDRDGDDVHRNETIQELASLSERFGLSVGFMRPDKQQYLEIVRQLKAQYGITQPDPSLEAEAERYALGRGGRSPRVARQFIDLKSAGTPGGT